MNDTEANKRNATAFCRTAFEGAPSEAVSKYVGAKCIQHNP